MPKDLKKSSASSSSSKRYAGKEKRGASEYKKEWSLFMTQVGRKRTSSGVNPNNNLLPHHLLVEVLLFPTMLQLFQLFLIV